MNKNLYLVKDGERKLLFDDVKEGELYILVNIYLQNNDIQAYIIRHIERDNGVKIDFGSHTDFLFWGE